MGNAPALRNIETKQLGQLIGGLFGHRIAPGAERSQQIAFTVKRKISVHHAGKTNRGKTGQLFSIRFFHLFTQLAVTILNTSPCVFQPVGPDTVFQPVFPVMAAGSNRSMIAADQYRFDTGGPQFNSECGFFQTDVFFYLFDVHFYDSFQ